MEALKVSEANLVVYLHPSKTKIVSDSIKRELSNLLFKYSETIDGVLLAFDFEILSRHAKILSGLYPYLGVRLKANLLLFDPKPETYLEGKVVKLAQESIHVIVLGFSAAVIMDEDIRDEFKFKIKDGEEMFRSISHKRHVIEVGSMIRFLVKSFDEEILHISGSLVPATTGSVRWFSKHAGEATLEERSSRKRKESKGKLEELSTGTVEAGALSNDHHMLKKSKKQRSHERS